ncbi:hypothetical protein FOA52_008086 [Chlamydomonas sp. UWO 241]|nr:hypothetical protein FOA52_008086 [Chlamydomonas sp. UWO 241]
MPSEPGSVEEEPQLKYKELGGDVHSITESDSVTCLCLSDKILALGTEQGNVHVLDYSGDEVRRLSLHKGRVNELSFDSAEEHIASCSDDCTVAIINLYTEEKLQYTYKKPIRTIAIDPRYASRRTKEYVSAGDDNTVSLSTQGWLGRADAKLHEGHVQAVRWAGALVAWGSDRSVTVYNTASHLQIRTVMRYPSLAAPTHRGSTGASTSGAAGAPSGAAASPGVLARASQAQLKPGQDGSVRILFGQNSKMYISWPDCIKIARIHVGESAVGSLAHKLEVTSEFYTDYFVLGVSPFGEDLAVLTYPTLAELTKKEQHAADVRAAGEGCEIFAAHAASPTPAVGGGGGGSGARGAAAGGVQELWREEVLGGCWRRTKWRDPGGGSGRLPAAHQVAPGTRPQLRILSTSNVQLACDELPISGWETNRHTDYLLVPSLPTTGEAATSSKLLQGHGLWGGRTPAAAPAAAAASPATAAAAAAASEASPSGGGSVYGDGNRRSQGFKAADVESMYFIVAPRSILVSCTRDMNDHVLWLLEQRRFDAALGIAEADRVGVQAETYEQVVQAYIDDLLTREDYESAAAMSGRLLKDNVGMWERWVFLFAQVRQLPRLAPHIPTERPRLREQAYEMILRSLLIDPSDHAMLLRLVRSWPPGLFSVPALQDAVAARMARPGGDDEHMWRLLSLLYVRQGRPELCLTILLQLRASDVFDFVETHALVAELTGARAPALLDIDEAQALRLLVRSADVLPPSAVVPAIQAAMDDATAAGRDTATSGDNASSSGSAAGSGAGGGGGGGTTADVWRNRLYRYLAGVLSADASAATEYHELQVRLTADYAPRKLMDFLAASQHYPLEGALSICQQQGLIPEQARFAADRGQMITIVSAYSPTEAASDEEAGDFYLRVAALADKANDKRDLLIVAGGSQRRAWDSSQLRRPAVRREFNLQLSDRFGLLEAVPPEGADAQAEYDAMAAAIREVATNHLAPRGSRRRRGWQFTLSQRTLRLMDARQRAHTAWLRSKSAAAKRERNRANRAADAAVQRDRERWIGQQVAEAQDMLRKKNLRQFARACDRLAGRSRSHQIPPAMRDVSGALHSGPDGVLKAMTESFDKLYGGETKLSDETLNQLENDVAAFELTCATEVDEAHGRPPDLAETEACVYILGRMGSSRQALHLIIEKLGDIPQAIDFVRAQRDEELWDYLITWALGSSETTGSLMDHAGGSINPLLLIRRLPRGLAVPRLRDRIRTIIGDFRTQTSLHEGCNVILRSDCMHLMQKLYSEARAALRCCYMEVKDPRNAQGTAQWHRYDSASGSFEHVPVHAMPDVVLGQTGHAPMGAGGVGSPRGGGGGAPGSGSPRPGTGGRPRLWVGLMLEDAATHVKLATKEAEGGTPRFHGPLGRGSKAAGRGGGGGGAYDAAAWAPQLSGPALPSLVSRKQ